MASKSSIPEEFLSAISDNCPGPTEVKACTCGQEIVTYVKKQHKWTRSLGCLVGTYSCALFNPGLCWAVQKLPSGLDHGYGRNFKQWPREWQFMARLSIRARRTPDSLVSFSRPWQSLFLVDVITNMVYSTISTWSVTCSCAFNLSFKYMFCVFQTFHHNENKTSGQVLVWKSLFMEATSLCVSPAVELLLICDSVLMAYHLHQLSQTCF